VVQLLLVGVWVVQLLLLQLLLLWECCAIDLVPAKAAVEAEDLEDMLCSAIVLEVIMASIIVLIILLMAAATTISITHPRRPPMLLVVLESP